MLKRSFDFVFALLGLVLLSPFFLIVAVAMKLSDRGPIFYRGTRVGRYGRPFRMLKFRSMVVDAEKIGGPSTAGDDPRLTRIGRFLRRYKLDELPQLVNVLRGEMSFVGPRPEVQRYIDMYTEEEKEILRVRPGITDWASIWNSDEGAVLAGSPDPEKAYLELIRPQKVKLQLEYARKRSFLVDLKILFTTLQMILFRKKPAILETHESKTQPVA